MSTFFIITAAIALIFGSLSILCAVIYSMIQARKEMEEIDFTLEEWRNPFL